MVEVSLELLARLRALDCAMVEISEPHPDNPSPNIIPVPRGALIDGIEALLATPTIPMILFCPNGHRHIDEQEFADKPHHTHACQECGIVWRPAKVNTHGVQFLPGYKNDA